MKMVYSAQCHGPNIDACWFRSSEFDIHLCERTKYNIRCLVYPSSHYCLKCSYSHTFKKIWRASNDLQARSCLSFINNSIRQLVFSFGLSCWYLFIELYAVWFSLIVEDPHHVDPELIFVTFAILIQLRDEVASYCPSDTKQMDQKKKHKEKVGKSKK